MAKPFSWRQLRVEWRVLSYYQRCEGLVALVLTLVVALIIVVALFRLTYGVVTGLLLGVLNPLDHGIFQSVFGEILTLLIALEFNHTPAICRESAAKHHSNEDRASYRSAGNCSKVHRS